MVYEFSLINSTKRNIGETCLMHSCRVHSFVECENFQNMFIIQKYLPVNFLNFSGNLFPISLGKTLFVRGSYQSFHELKIFYLSLLDPKTFIEFFL